MTENTTTDEYIYKYKSINEQSTDDINNSAIILKQYESFTYNDYFFIRGITDNNNIYIECKKNEKYYKKIISKKKLSLINDKFQSCKNINEIFKLILFSINKKQINITTLKNNKIKFNLTLITEENISSPFEIILKEEKNKNDILINKVNKKNNENNSDIQKEKENSESLFMEEELQYIKKELLSNKNNKKVNLSNNDLNKEKIENKNNNEINEINKNININLIDNEVEEQEENEDLDDNYSNENINIENENNKIINNINKLKKEIIYIKNFINKNEKNNNDEKIKE